MYFDPNSKPSISDRFTSNVSPTTLTLFGTTQVLEARNSNYYNFDLVDLYATTRTILKRQVYMVYTWSLTYFCLQNKRKVSLIDSKFFNVKQFMFEPNDAEVKLYLANPKFLWRFSMNNYSFFADHFDHHISASSTSSSLVAYHDDDSPILPYLDSKFFKNRKTNFFARSSKETSSQFDAIDQLLNGKINFALTDYETSEYLYSDDFFLHQINGEANYMDFVHCILTGHDGVSPTPLLKAKLVEEQLKLPDVRKGNVLKLKKMFSRKVESQKMLPRSSNCDALNEYIKSKKPLTNYQYDYDDLVNHLPKTAVRFLGFNDDNIKFEKSDTVQILNAMVKRNKEYVEISSRFFKDSNWIEECYDILDNSQIQFYKFVLELFDYKYQLSSFMYEKGGIKFRIPWSLPCSETFADEIKIRFIDNVVKPQVNFFGKKSTLKNIFSDNSCPIFVMNLYSIIQLKKIYQVEKEEQVMLMNYRLLEKSLFFPNKDLITNNYNLLVEEIDHRINFESIRNFSTRQNLLHDSLVAANSKDYDLDIICRGIRNGEFCFHDDENLKLDNQISLKLDELFQDGEKTSNGDIPANKGSIDDDDDDNNNKVSSDNNDDDSSIDNSNDITESKSQQFKQDYLKTFSSDLQHCSNKVFNALLSNDGVNECFDRVSNLRLINNKSLTVTENISNSIDDKIKMMNSLVSNFDHNSNDVEINNTLSITNSSDKDNMINEVLKFKSDLNNSIDDKNSNDENNNFTLSPTDYNDYVDEKDSDNDIIFSMNHSYFDILFEPGELEFKILLPLCLITCLIMIRVN